MIKLLLLHRSFLCLLLFPIFCGIAVHNNAFAQRLDDVGKDKPLKVSGSISTSQVGYLVSGISGRRDPYNLYVSGNLNFDLYGWSVPLGFTFSNQSKGSFQQPFNQYGLTPVYKWVTGHLGYSSMFFSNYTLSGHLFNGVGVDLAPAGNFKISAMYGRLQKPVFIDTLSEQVQAIEPAYKRMGYGIKTSYTKNKDHADLILFKAKDDLLSNPSIPVNGIIAPQDNLVGGISGSKMILDKLILNGEFALSALTRDQRATADSIERGPVPDMGFLLSSNVSTALYTAYKIGIAYNAGRYVLGAGYERVAPEYKTLGAYYFNNDFENITGNINTKLWADKINLSLNAGIQRDDLRNSKQSSMKRFVGSAAITYQAGKKLNFNAVYSNFQSFVNIKSSFNQINQLTPYDNLDTLNFTQISQNINLSTNHILGQDKQKTRILNFNISMVTSADEQGGQKQNSGGQFYNLNSSYSINFIPKNFSFTTSVNANRNQVSVIKTTTIGPTVGISKSFFEKKLRSSVSSSLNSSYANSVRNSTIINCRLNNNYVLKKKHQLNFGAVLLSKAMQSAATSGYADYNEVTATFGYNYSF